MSGRRRCVYQADAATPLLAGPRTLLLTRRSAPYKPTSHPGGTITKVATSFLKLALHHTGPSRLRALLCVSRSFVEVARGCLGMKCPYRSTVTWIDECPSWRLNIGGRDATVQHQARVGVARIVDTDVADLGFLQQWTPHSVPEPRIITSASPGRWRRGRSTGSSRRRRRPGPVAGPSFARDACSLRSEGGARGVARSPCARMTSTLLRTSSAARPGSRSFLPST